MKRPLLFCELCSPKSIKSFSCHVFPTSEAEAEVSARVPAAHGFGVSNHIVFPYPGKALNQEGECLPLFVSTRASAFVNSASAFEIAFPSLGKR